MSAKPIKLPHDLLLDYQREYANDQARFKAGCWARQTGKDFTSTNEVVRDSIVQAKNTWMIAAPSERQSLEALDKCKDWLAAYKVAIDDVTEERNGYQALLSRATVHLPNGSRIIAVPGRPDTVRGYSANTYLTEFAFFEDADATWRAIFPSITNPLRGGLKKMRIHSTPNGKTGSGRRFYEIVRDNLLEPKASRKFKWAVYMLTIHDAVKRGLPVDIEQLRAGMDDAIGWAQEMECQFLDSTNVLLPYDLISLAESAMAEENCPPSEWAGGGPVFLGIDFGRVNDPTVCWALQQVGDLLITREVLVLENMASDVQQEVLSSRISAASRVCFDYTGPGIGLGDYMVTEHGEFNPSGHEFGKVELCTFTTGFKREIFPRLRRVFEAPTRVRIPVSVEIREDLHAMQQIIRNGEYLYSAPRTAAGHSDRCTALALANRAASFPAPAHMPRRFSLFGSARRAASANHSRRSREVVLA